MSKMRYTASIVFAAVGLVTAQTSTSSAAVASGTAASGCVAQIDLTVEICLSTENSLLSVCAPTDWDCLCIHQTNVLTCYNTCPSDLRAFGAQQTQTSYCNAAKAYPSSSSSTATMSATASISSALSALVAESSTLASVTSDYAATASATGSSSAAAVSATSTDSAATSLAPAGSFLVAIFGLAAML